MVGCIMITHYVTSIGLYYNNVGILLGGCLTCEELSGGYLQEMTGLVL